MKSAFVDRRVKHHNPSYYLRGGIDLARRERPPLESVPAHSEDIANDVINVFTDARTSKLDIIVMASETSVKKAREKAREEMEANL